MSATRLVCVWVVASFGLSTMVVIGIAAVFDPGELDGALTGAAITGGIVALVLLALLAVDRYAG